VPALLAIALAAGLDVSPVQIDLSRETAKALLTLHNGGEETVRYQVSVFAWDESPTTGMKLDKTDNIIIFPQIFTLKPNDSHNIQIKTTMPFGQIKKTYHIF